MPLPLPATSSLRFSSLEKLDAEDFWKAQKRKLSSNLLRKTTKLQKILHINDGRDTDISVPTYHEKQRLEDLFHETLPLEIQWTVLKVFREDELLNMRLVSKTWKATIDSFFKVDARIDGSKEDFDGRCGLSMKSCKLIALQNPSHRILFNSMCPEVVQIQHGICQRNFSQLILQWSNLSKLEICWRSIMKNLLCHSKNPISGKGTSTLARNVLPCLTCLKIEVVTSDSLGKTTMLRISTNLKKITSFEYPSLASFQIIFVGYREIHANDRHLDIFLPFVQRHASSLKSIEFSLNYASQVSYPPIHPRHILFCVPANIKYYYKAPYGAKEGRLITTCLQRPDDCSDQEWIQLLQNTRKLDIAIRTRFLNWTIRHLEFFTPTISTFSKFLRRIDLMNVTMYDSGSHNTATQIDANIFSQCKQLIQLRIFRAPIIFHEDETDPAAEIINLHQLPESLEDLNVDGLPVSSADLLATIKKLHRLTHFRYFQSQVPRRNILDTNGINWEILQTLMQHKHMTFIRVHATSLAQTRCYAMYDDALNSFATEYGWNTTGIAVGYMNLFEVTLLKGNCSE